MGDKGDCAYCGIWYIDISSDNNYVFCVRWIEKLYILDIQDKSNPVVLSEIEGYFDDLAISPNGNYIYIAENYEYFPEPYDEFGGSIIDISDKSNPIRIGRIPVIDYISESNGITFSKDGEFVYIAHLY